MSIARIVVAAIAVSALTAVAQAKSWDFEDAAAGKLPPGWAAAKSGTGPGSVWTVQDDASAPKGPKVLAQTSSEGAKPLFNLCLADASLGDVDLSVSLKAVRGKIDQGGGPLWRAKDANNYYVVRVNPLEANFRLYKVVAGKRTQLASADVEPIERKWQTIRVVHQGDRIRCYIYDVRSETKGPQIMLSRAHGGFMAKLFAQAQGGVLRGRGICVGALHHGQLMLTIPAEIVIAPPPLWSADALPSVVSVLVACTATCTPLMVIPV